MGKVFTKGYWVKKPVIDPLDGKVLHKWQKEIVEMVQDQPDDRKIYWYYSNCGNIGKTALCKHLVMKHNAIVVGGKAQDAFYAISARIHKGKEVNIVVFHLVRSKRDEIDFVGIEGIKDGMFFSPKYESEMCVFNTPHVLVFANMRPGDVSKLSEDRWVIKDLEVHSIDARHNEYRMF